MFNKIRVVGTAPHLVFEGHEGVYTNHVEKQDGVNK